MGQPNQNQRADPNRADKSKSGNLVRSFSMNVRAVEGDGNERKRIISFSSEEPYKRWFGIEILSHADGAVDLTRLNSIGVVLFNHNRDRVAGKIIRAWVEDGRGCAEIEFDDDQEADVIFKKVDSGTLKGVSVGYAVRNWEEVAAGSKSKDKRFDGPCSIAVDWEPFEVSIVSVPADATVGVGREMDGAAEDQSCTAAPFKRGLSVYESQIQVNKNLL